MKSYQILIHLKDKLIVTIQYGFPLKIVSFESCHIDKIKVCQTPAASSRNGSEDKLAENLWVGEKEHK